MTEKKDPSIELEKESAREISNRKYEEQSPSMSEYLLKICIIGSCGQLKTNLVRHYAGDKFDGNYIPTLGVDITTKKEFIKDTQTKLILVDTPPQKFYGKRTNFWVYGWLL